MDEVDMFVTLLRGGVRNTIANSLQKSGVFTSSGQTPNEGGKKEAAMFSRIVHKMLDQVK